ERLAARNAPQGQRGAFWRECSGGDFVATMARQTGDAQMTRPEPSRPELEVEAEAAAGRRTAQRGRPIDFELELATGQQAQQNQQSRLEAEQAAGRATASRSVV